MENLFFFIRKLHLLYYMYLWVTRSKWPHLLVKACIVNQSRQAISDINKLFLYAIPQVYQGFSFKKVNAISHSDRNQDEHDLLIWVYTKKKLANVIYDVGVKEVICVSTYHKSLTNKEFWRKTQNMFVVFRIICYSPNKSIKCTFRCH